MIKFIFKAILRDRNRSVLPVLVITIGVFLTIFLSGFMGGVMGDMIDQTARFETGHVKIMSQAYATNKEQIPNDLAILASDTLTEWLEKEYDEYSWTQRIRFGGLIDAPDTKGESKGQGPTSGFAIDLLSPKTEEVKRLNINSSIVEGRIPTQSKEILVGYKLAKNLHINIGDTISFMGTTMNGSMTFDNFILSGTVRFGVEAMDKGMTLIDIKDARHLLDMDHAAGEIVGFLKDGVYFDEKAQKTTHQFNAKFTNKADEFSPIMVSLRNQNNMGTYLDYVNSFNSMFVTIFILIMSIVLWNTGLIGGLRRYQEFGIRLALGEEKKHVYKTLLLEALLVGVIGSITGSFLGITATLLMQIYGIDVSGMMQGGTMMMPTIIRAKFSANMLYIGFIPGVFAMVIGNLLSGIAIYRRQTSNLFKELEV